MNDLKMEQIILSMGKSTVLRFPERPKKVILGNQNYFHVEFIDNDITIQPQGNITTNLFVYGNNHIYGFILKSGNGAKYDDLIKVRWEPKKIRRFSQKKEVQRPLPPKGIHIEVKIKDILKITIETIWFSKMRDLYTLDLLIYNRSNNTIPTSDVKIGLIQKGKSISRQFLVFGDDEIAPGKSSKARLFFRPYKNLNFVIKVQHKGESTERIISRRFL